MECGQIRKPNIAYYFNGVFIMNWNKEVARLFWPDACTNLYI